MVQHTWTKLHKLIFLFLGAFSLAIFVPVTIAIARGDVSPYVPYISEGGGNFPQAGIFTTMIVVAVSFSQTMMIFRYLVIEERCSDNPKHLFVNKVALVIGTLDVISFVMVGAFPTTLVGTVHNVVAGMTSLTSVLYMACHTWISLNSISESRMKKIRLALTIFGFISIASMAVFGGLGSFYWNSYRWPGKKRPGDQGFAFYLVSALSEWILGAVFFGYFATFYQDFKRSVFQFQLTTAPVQKAKPHLVTVKVGQ